MNEHDRKKKIDQYFLPIGHQIELSGGACVE